MKNYLSIGGCWFYPASPLYDAPRVRGVSSGRYQDLVFRFVKANNKVPDSGEGEKPVTIRSNGEQS